MRYPRVSRIHFLECSGNSAAMYNPAPPNLTAGQTHGLVSCSEWTGVPLRSLLEEAGVDPGGQWVLAEGADAAAMSRSIPIAKAMDDALLALFQNGERLRPENGYPVRLFLPGYEGNMSVKWLRRLKVVAAPAMTKDETSRYTDLQADGKALMFTFPIARPHAERTRTLRDLRGRVVGQRRHLQGGGVRRRWADVDDGTARHAGFGPSDHALPPALEVEWQPCGAEIARDRHDGRGAA